MPTQDALPGVDIDAVQVIDQEHHQERLLFEEMLGDLAWSDTYRALLDEGWAWRKAAYIAWASQPASYRAPETQQDFASLIGLRSTRAIRTWRNQNKAIDLAVQKLCMASLLDGAPDVIEAMVESASNPGYKHAPDRRLFADIMQWRKTEIGLYDAGDQADDLEEMSTEELARLAGTAQGGDDVS